MQLLAHSILHLGLNTVIAGNFRGSKYSWLDQQYLAICGFLFSWLLLALQVKVGKVASFMGKISVVQC